LTKIKINNARFYAYHGVLDYEKQYGNEFEIDIEMKCDLSALKDTDELNNTVDYLSVYKFVEKTFTEKKYNLIETVNQNICRGILENFPQVLCVKVKIRKPNAPLGIIDSVEVINKLHVK
jgi:7,8-dihydroneopterin aldolase/epimerase/oxygenase